MTGTELNVVKKNGKKSGSWFILQKKLSLNGTFLRQQASCRGHHPGMNS